MTAVIDSLLAVPARNAPPRACELERTLGRAGACPRRLCPFWEAGGAAIRPGCALSRTPLDLDRAGVADLVMGLRQRIQQPVSAEDQRQTEREFRRLLAVAFDDDWE